VRQHDPVRARTPLALLPFALALACAGERVSPMRLDRIYRSMEGPATASQFQFSDGPPELLWITAYRTRVVGRDGEAVSQEFMCHNNLDFDYARHAEVFGWTLPHGRIDRLFTASQGQFEVDLPPGFGIPVLSNEPLSLSTQVLNHNVAELDIEVRHRIEIEYVRDADARGRLQPVFPAAAYVLALVDGQHGVYGVENPSALQSGASCLPGEVAPQSQSSGHGAKVDSQGRTFTGHWVVLPGREVRRTLVNSQLQLPFDTTVHFIATHLHPFAESLELRDLTAGESVFRTTARQPASGIGLASVEALSSPEGIPLYADHDYELVSVYENTSGVNQDAMASFFLYLRDPQAEEGLEAIRRALAGPSRVGPLARGAD
jgi:hypothetical protein